MDEHSLQRIIFPDESRTEDAELFFRCSDSARRATTKNGCIELEPGETIDLCTFFNAFSFRKWTDAASIGRIGIQFRGQGRITAVISGYSVGNDRFELQSSEMDLKTADTIWLENLTQHEELATLAVDIIAGSLTHLEPSLWVTDTAPRRNVSIAAVVTTFKREEMAERAIRKFETSILPDPASRTGHLFVIDNGQSLQIDTTDAVSVIPNKNLGGAGGFTRGLLEAQDRDGFTHVLFMDDDADCHPESVRRTAALLSYAKDENTAVSGAMFLSDRRTIQHEKSAVFALSGRKGKTITQVGHESNLAQQAEVVQNDLVDIGNFGGWWFFCFPIDKVEALPFPFFVRGDDIEFSLVNNFDILTLNGVASWCDDFAQKWKPSTTYLAHRAELAISALHASEERMQRHAEQILKMALRAGRVFDYQDMEAMIAAMTDFLEGPHFFSQNKATMNRLAEFRTSENTSIIEADESRLLDKRPPHYRETLSGVIRQAWTLDGHRRTHAYKEDIAWTDQPKEVASLDTSRYKKIVIKTEYGLRVFERDNNRYLKNWSKIKDLERQIRRRAPKLISLYRDNHHAVRSYDFWRRSLGIAASEMNMEPQSGVLPVKADSER